MSYDIIIYGATSDLQKVLKLIKEALRVITVWRSEWPVQNIFKEITVFYVYILNVGLYETAKHCKLLHLYQPSQQPYHKANCVLVEPNRLDTSKKPSCIGTRF